MAIILRKKNGKWTAHCAAEVKPEEGEDVYLDDGIHTALTEKFEKDFIKMGFMERRKVKIGRKIAKSRWPHDCEECIYCGQIGKYDVWYHPLGDEKSIILRYGAEGKYHSMAMELIFRHYL